MQVTEAELPSLGFPRNMFLGTETKASLAHTGGLLNCNMIFLISHSSYFS